MTGRAVLGHFAAILACFVSWTACFGAEEKPATLYNATGRPTVYSNQSLSNFLGAKLAAKEMALVKNPLTSNPEMDAWAKQITAGTTNELLRAKMIFDELVRRDNRGANATRTAQEVYAAWKTPGVGFSCEEYADFYVALARAAGLSAFLVIVVEQESGTTPRHGCAALFVGDEVTMVDPSIPWFGVPHRNVQILDDPRAIAAYMVQAGGLAECRIAYKLCPELSVVESNFYLKLMEHNQWDEAKRVLEDMPKWNTDAWVTNLALGYWRRHEGKFDLAIDSLRQSIRQNPWVGVSRHMLGDTLKQAGKLHEARAELCGSLSIQPGTFSVNLVRMKIMEIDDKLAEQKPPDKESKAEAETDQKLASAGNTFAMVLLARRYERGSCVEQDEKLAAQWYCKAAEAGEARAMSRLGALYAFGNKIPRDFDQAKTWLTKAAGLDDFDAMHYLGVFYDQGLGVKKDSAEAIRWYERAGTGGSVYSMTALGKIYYYGRGVMADHSRAFTWFRKAADSGDNSAMVTVGNLYLSGDGVAKDNAKAFEYHLRAANGGIVHAMNLVGQAYEKGIGVERDFAKALEWLKKAADGRNGAAIHEIGSMYMMGFGVAKDEREGARWFQKGADIGDSASLNDLGSLYFDGKGVARDLGKAVELIRKSADAGFPQAMLNLGQFYENGWGIKKDEAEAIKWFQKAEKGGLPEATKRLEALKKRADNLKEKNPK